MCEFQPHINKEKQTFLITLSGIPGDMNGIASRWGRSGKRDFVSFIDVASRTQEESNRRKWHLENKLWENKKELMFN